MPSTHRIIGHNLRLILERVADVAVLVAGGTHRSIVQLILVGQIRVPLVAVILPRHVVLQHHVCDAALARPWDGERRVARIRVRISVATVPKVPGIVVVQQVVVTLIAVRLDRLRQRSQVFEHRPNTRLVRTRTIAVPPTALHSHRTAEVSESSVAILNPEIVRAGNWIWILDLVYWTSRPRIDTVRRH